MKKIVFVMIMGVALILSACGAAKPSTTINVSLTDFQFQPASATVPAGKEITFNGTNTGAVVHNYVVMKLGTTAGDIFDDEDLPNVYWEVELPPGQEAHVTFTAPNEPGEYQVVCRTQGHIASGMTGTLKVVAEE